MGASIAVSVRFRLHEVLAERSEELSQSELSRRSGVSLTTVNAIALNKTRQVSLETLDKLCEALGVEPGELLERDESRRKRGR
jgi:putative transcriptional regulator